MHITTIWTPLPVQAESACISSDPAARTLSGASVAPSKVQSDQGHDYRAGLREDDIPRLMWTPCSLLCSGVLRALSHRWLLDRPETRDEVLGVIRHGNQCGTGRDSSNAEHLVRALSDETTVGHVEAPYPAIGIPSGLAGLSGFLCNRT